MFIDQLIFTVYINLVKCQLQGLLSITLVFVRETGQSHSSSIPIYSKLTNV